MTGGSAHSPPPPRTPSHEIRGSTPCPTVSATARTSSRKPYRHASRPAGGHKDHGLDAKAVDVKNVKTILTYASRFDPPYIFCTSMPAP